MLSTLLANSRPPRSVSRALSKAAIVAAPMIACTLFAPAKAQPSTFTRTFTGFTEAFAPSQWAKQVENDGTGSLSTTTMNLVATDSSPNGGGAQYQFGPTTKLDSWFKSSWNADLGKDASDTNWKFTTGKATFDWTWTFTNAPGVIYPLQTFVGTQAPRTLWQFNGGDLNSLSSYTTSGTSSIDITTPDSFGFRMFSSLGNNFFGDGTASITNFKFEANYVYVPGPLPAAAAVAGFAWSRKLRRRLKVAGSEA